MRSILLFPVLAGCPYIFGGPDLGNVDGVLPVDTDDTDPIDTDVETETETDTDVTPTIPGDPPTLTSGQVVVVFVDRIEIELSVVDADADLLGGAIHLSDGVNLLQTWDIPEDISGWDPAGVNRIVHYVTIPCTGYAPDLNLVVEDFAGHASDAAPLNFGVVAVAAMSSSTTFQGVVVPSVPATWCSTGNLVNPSPPVEDDYFYFPNPTATDLLVMLDWDPLLFVDFDLLLYTTPGPPTGFVSAARTISFDGHEQVRSKNLGTLGAEFGVQVETWDFSAGGPTPSGPWPYQVIVQEAP